MFSHAKWNEKPERRVEQLLLSLELVVSLRSEQWIKQMIKQNKGMSNTNKNYIPVVLFLSWASHRSLSLSISFTMSHIWLCTENTCKENILHIFCISLRLQWHLKVSTADYLSFKRRRLHELCSMRSLNSASHVKENTSIVSTGIFLRWADLGYHSSLHPDTHGWHKINLLAVIQPSYSSDLHVRVWKTWSKSSSWS